MGSKVQSLVEVAEHFGRSKSAVTGWRKAGGPVQKPPYDLDRITLWLQSRQAKKAVADVDAKKELGLWRRARRRITELELSKRRGRLMAVDVHEEKVSRLGMMVRTTFMSLPHTLAPELAYVMEAGEVYAILDREIRNNLVALSIFDLPPEAEALIDQAASIVAKSRKPQLSVVSVDDDDPTSHKPKARPAKAKK